MVLLSIAMITAGVFRRSSIPFTVLLVIIGLTLSELSKDIETLEFLQHFRLTPDLVFFVFLPALIFESGLSLNARQLIKDLAPILTLAIPALLISTTLVGIGAWLLLDINFVLALLFGALISATDPVAVVALFKELGAPLRLNVLVEGESLFNDATAIVVFSILLTMATQHTHLDAMTSLSAIIEFVRVFIGGVLVGGAIGLLVSELLYRLHSSVSAVLTMSIVTAYASFIIGEHLLHISGVMATVSAAVALNVYGLTRLPANVKPTLSETWEFVGLVANSMLFLLVGLSIDALTLWHHLDVILLIVVIVLLARAATIYSLVPATTWLFKLPKISLAEQHIMWWGGLKGGLAIAIAISIPESLEGRDLLITLTLGVVLFTLLVNAMSIRPLMQSLKLDQLNDDEKEELKQAFAQAKQSSNQMIEQFQSFGLINDSLKNQLSSHINKVLNKKKKLPKESSSQHKRYLTALKIELDTLNKLYAAGIINQYTLTDIRNTLQLDRDRHSHVQCLGNKVTEHKKTNIFISIEKMLLKNLREKNWAAKLLSRYQTMRLNQRIQRDIAGVAMSKAVLDYFNNFDSADSKDKKLAEQRLERRQQRLSDLQQQFPDVYLSIVSNIFRIASFKTAQLEIEYNYHHGEMSTKVYNHINQILESTLLLLHKKQIIHATDIKKLIASVHLFHTLSEQSITTLAQHAQHVTFLENDIIIGEGDHGDSLYIIEKGQARACVNNNAHSKNLARFKAGDFFGEMALLGDKIRTATVTATSTISLIRLTKQDVLMCAKIDPELKMSLEQAKDARLKAS